jgi:hypothetical protein
MSYLSDDRWRDSYDAWKLASPYDNQEDGPDYDLESLIEAFEEWLDRQ